ncbi:MAG: allophanate hydrolase-related protein, partial [Afipia sp.]
ALYKLEAMRQISRKTFESIDAMVLPTAPTAYTVEQVLANPIELNSRNGTYTNFVNLLDMCGLAVPAAMRADGIPFGITLLAPAGHDAQLASIGRVFHADTKLRTGAKGVAQPPLTPVSKEPGKDEVAIVAVGAHLSGMALNHELLSLGGRLIEATSTAPDYKLYALKGTVPPKPGMLRVETGTGAAIAVEVWALPTKAFGAFVAAIPSPLSIGSVRLADGSAAKGFLVEAMAVEGARDITSFGGWRAFIAAQAKSA